MLPLFSAIYWLIGRGNWRYLSSLSLEQWFHSTVNEVKLASSPPAPNSKTLRSCSGVKNRAASSDGFRWQGWMACSLQYGHRKGLSTNGPNYIFMGLWSWSTAHYSWADLTDFLYVGLFMFFLPEEMGPAHYGLTIKKLSNEPEFLITFRYLFPSWI